jgi:transposase
MAAPLSVDLRQRVVDAYENGDKTVEQVAAQFRVGPASLKRWVAKWRSSGSVAPKPPVGGRPPKLTSACEEVLRTLVEEQPDAYCWELAERLEAKTSVKVDEDTVGRALRRMNLTRKKKR